ncbi:MAG TPA: MBL fold metallo-hydrolase [bacterium]|nr:MBL fold metallo-hydrolase [bacterium]
MEILFLGAGSATPLPRPGHECPQCRSRDARDRRSPSALLIDRRILIDAGPSITTLLAAVGRAPEDIAAVVLTHRHRDAAGGLAVLPAGTRVVVPERPGRLTVAGHRFEAVRVPHAGPTWGYLVDGVLAYFSDYSRIGPALSALRRARIAVLDGSGWRRTFPSHQPMVDVIPIVKRLHNLRRVLFTHVGHCGLPHAELERRTRALGDDRFGIAYHGLRLTVRRT